MKVLPIIIGIVVIIAITAILSPFLFKGDVEKAVSPKEEKAETL